MPLIIRHLLFLCITLLFLTGCSPEEETSIQDKQPEPSMVPSAKTKEKKSLKKRVLFVNSYHPGYDWSDKLTEGVADTFGAMVDKTNEQVLSDLSPVDLKIAYMDSKRNFDQVEEKAKEIYAFSQKWNPDIIIASDDNAAKYFLKPYFSNSSTPVIFCGLNWDESIYGFPTKNMTGMVEVGLITPMLDVLKQYSKEPHRIGIIADDTPSARKSANHFANNLGINFTESVFVSSYDGFKKEYLRLQDAVDILIFQNYVGINDFDEQDAKKFIKKNTKIPTGSNTNWMAPYVLMSYAKIPNEQGEWAANAALKILDGTKPENIAIARNSKAEIYLNHSLAYTLKIEFPLELEKISLDHEDSSLYSHASIDQKDYGDVTLNILTHEIPNIGEPTVLHATQFAKLTGAKVIVTHVPMSRLHDEMLLGLKKGSYDVVFYLSLWIAEAQPLIEPIPESMLSSAQYQKVIPHYKEVAKWEGVPYQVPIDGDRHYLQYRKDVLESAKNRKLFLEATGRELTPPKTWEELNEIVKFLHGSQTPDGKTVAGIVEITKLDDLLFAQFIKRAAPYAKHPKVKGGFYFELETMKPLINNPGFVRALEHFVETSNYHPNQDKDHTLESSIVSFGNGDAIFSDSWDDSFIQAMEPNSLTRGKVVASPSPGSKTVWNRKTGQWDYFKNVNYAPYVAHGWTAAVAANSKHKEAAFDFLGFFANPENHAEDLLVGRYGINPFRKEDLYQEFWTQKAGWDKDIANSYIATLKNIGASKNKVMDLRIHLSEQYMYSLATGVYRALTGRTSPQDALDIVAEEWDSLTKRVGFEKQQEAYRHIVKFEDSE